MVCHMTDFRGNEMDLSSKNMYDAFKDEIWKELGPLDPDWFEVLTAQTVNNEDHVSDQDDLCANQEGQFKAPLDKTTVSVNSQLFSTPKVFRHRRAVSPETENEQSFTAEQEKEKMSWTATQSPCLFTMSKEELPGAKYNSIQLQSLDSFDLLQTPQKSPMSYSRQITESLGAQVHPDMTWTSSLNTPPGVPSTLILTKPDGSPCAESLSPEKSVVLVRELFPSVSSVRVEVRSPENADKPAGQRGPCSPEFVENPDDQNPDSHDSHLNQSDDVWKQKLPDAIEDVDVRSTVASVLKGAETALSLFFTNSNSALRKVKTDSNKRKQIIRTEDPDCSATETATTTNNAGPEEQETADQEPGKLPSSPPLKTGDNGLTQWSPLSLSDIPSCTASCYDTSTVKEIKNSSFTEQIQKDSDSGKPLTVTDSGFLKKKRKFIYSVKTPKQSAQEEEPRSERTVSPRRIHDSGSDLNMKQLEKAPVEADCCSMTEIQNISAQAEVEDLDMSQLCRDFAQDTSEMSDPDQTEDIPQNVFSPSACLSAMKQAKQKAKQTNCEGTGDIKQISTTTQNILISEVTISDSGFQSAVTDITHMTASSFAVPSSENICQSQQQSGLKTDLHRAAPLPNTNKENVHLDHILQADAKLSCAITDSQFLDLGRESESHIKNASMLQPSRAKGPVDNIDRVPFNGQICVSLPEKTAPSLQSAHAAGFKTASNKGIHISSANLQKARRMFEEAEGEMTLGVKFGRDTTGGNPKSQDSVKTTTTTTTLNSKQPPPPSCEKLADSSFQLTASQRADVSELCTLLEEADSQFELTPFKTSKPKQPCADNTASPQTADKDLDPDFLAGIDFDDSFSLDAEQPHAGPVRHQNTNSIPASNITNKATGLSPLSSVTEEKSSAEDVSASISEGGSGFMSAEVKNADKAPRCKNPLMLSVGFKTAGGGNVRISKKCLSKAKALFADLEENRKEGPDAKAQHQQSGDNHLENALNHKEDNSEFKSLGNNPAGKIQNIKASVCLDEQVSGATDDTTKSLKSTNSWQGGFQMASGKGVCVSAKALQEADAFFKDCDVIDRKESVFEKPRKKTEPLCRSVRRSDFKDKPSPAHTAAPHGNLSVSAKAPPSLSCTTPKNITSSSIDKLAEDPNKLLKQSATHRLNYHTQAAAPDNVGFHTASGKGVAISADALKKAKSFFSECDEIRDEIGGKTETHFKTPIPRPAPRSGGFLSAGGKSAALSAEALQNTNALFNLDKEIPSGSDKRRNNNKEEETVKNKICEKINVGFSTAGGARVHVSKTNLLKAKNLWKEFDSVSEKAMQEADEFFKDCDITDNYGAFSDEKKLVQLKEDLNVTNISEKSVNGCSEMKNVGTVKNHEKMKPPDDKELHKTFHENTPGPANEAPSNRNPPLMTKPVSSPLCAASNDTGASEFGAGGGFFTANGRKVSVSDDAMAKAKSLFSEGAAFESSNNQVHQEKDNMSVQRGGFQTASGKGVSISSAALKKAKTLFGECDEIEDKVGVTPAQIETPDSGQSTRNRPFLSAGGKPVSVSSESLQKAKSLFDDISLNAETPAISDSSTSDKKQNPGHRGFTTAGGTKVHISHKSLLKAQTLWKEFNDGDLHGVHQSDPATSKSDLAAATYKEMPPEKSYPLEVKSLNSVKKTAHQNETTQNSSLDKKPEDASKLEEADKLHDSPKEETSSVFDRLLNRRTRSEGSGIKLTDESSVLCLQSLHLSGFSETQQKILAQEALDCTRALLEDERVAGQDLSMSTENAPQQDEPRSCEEHKGRGKRPAEDSDVGGQPPLKRRLLEDFDRTVSALQPEISNSNGMMKDRRVFKYSDSLHPNITKPHRNGNQYVESKLQKTAPTQLSSSGGSRSKTQAFVPPFLKNPKTESRKNAMLRENIRTPPAFVPPFKKQRTIIQESSSRPGEGEDKHCSVAGMPANSNTYEPPTENTQSSAQRTANESKDDNQAVASDDITKDNLIRNENLPEDSAAGDTSGSQEMLQDLQNVELARDMQDMRIRKKKRQTIRPLPGSLFLTKTSGESRTPLKAAVDGKAPARFTQKQLYEYGVHQYVCEITGETAESFRFRLQHFIKQEAFIDGGGVQLADGGWLIPSNDGTAGKQEFYRALCDTPGVDPKLISEEWVYNHYRWIVWKQASMERSFPRTVGGLCLTPEQVLLQLKYRYDVEVDHSRRPALRRIMEKDDTAAKTLVLCVCGVVSRGQSPKKQSFSDAKTPQGGDARVENPCAVVWLTDGWYAIKAQLDEPLTAMLHKGRLAVGGKLITHGAQLVGSQDACSPLEAPESLMLKICANSSRPTRWDVKLGFHRDPRPFLLPVSSFYSNGGPVGCVDIVILRSYPLQWMERKPDGGVVFRSVRAEEKEARRFNNDKQKAMEVLFTKIQAEFEKEERGKSKPQRRRRTISRRDVTSLQDGEELYEAVEEDPGYLEAQLSEQQLNTLQGYRRSLMERKQAELQDRYRRALESAETSEGSCPKRDVTPVWRLCFSDSRGHPGSIYLLNLWRPTSDLQSLLKEGCRYKAYNLTTSDGKKLGANPSVQLTGTKKTQFQDLQFSQEWLSTRFQPRVSTPFVDLHNPEFQPLCGEVDLTGLLISVIDGQGSSPAFYLADGKLNFVKIRCFGSLAQSGLEDLVKPRILLALSNLQLRGQSTHPTPVVYAGDLTTFSTNPKEVHLRESLSQLRNLMQSQENFFQSAEEKLRLVLRSDGPHFMSSPCLQTGISAPSTERRQSTKMNLISQHQARNLGSFTPVSRNPPSETESSTEKNPSTLKRKRALDYLSRIPSPPPLTLLNSVNSPCVKKTFNPPRRSGTPSTLKPVQTPARKPVDQPVEREWVNDEELAMIDTQDLL